MHHFCFLQHLGEGEGEGGGGAWVINLRELKNTLYLSFVVFVVPHLLCFVVENFKNAFNVL